MTTRRRIFLLASLLFLVSIAGIVKTVWELRFFEQLPSPRVVFSSLLLLGLFGGGMIFSILELLRQETKKSVSDLVNQLTVLKKLRHEGRRLILTGNRQIDGLINEINDLLDTLGQDQHLYKTLAVSSPDMIYMLDRDGRILFANAKTGRLSEYMFCLEAAGCICIKELPVTFANV
jgi:PAS domain-containing protein